jgi:hypothetical protein
VWEWGFETRVVTRKKSHRRFAVFGTSFQVDLTRWRDSKFPWTFPPREFDFTGHFTIGFRTLLTTYDVKISSVDFSRKFVSAVSAKERVDEDNKEDQ